MRLKATKLPAEIGTFGVYVSFRVSKVLRKKVGFKFSFRFVLEMSFFSG